MRPSALWLGRIELYAPNKVHRKPLCYGVFLISCSARDRVSEGVSGFEPMYAVRLITNQRRTYLSFGIFVVIIFNVIIGMLLTTAEWFLLNSTASGKSKI